MAEPIIITDYLKQQNTALLEIANNTTEAMQNQESILGMETDLNDNATTCENKVNIAFPIVAEMNGTLSEQGTTIDNLIIEEDAVLDSLADSSYFTDTVTLPGTIFTWIPIFFNFDKTHSQYLNIWRTPDMDVDSFNNRDLSPGCVLHIIGSRVDYPTDSPGRFTIRKLDEVHGPCIALPNARMYSSKTIDGEFGHYAIGKNGLFLRGGLTYHIRSNAKDMFDDLLIQLSQTSVPDSYEIIGLDGLTYYTKPFDYPELLGGDWDPTLWPFGDTQYKPVINLDTGNIFHGVGPSVLNECITDYENYVITTDSSSVKVGELSYSSHSSTCVSNGTKDTCVVEGGIVYPGTSTIPARDQISSIIVSTGSLRETLGQMSVGMTWQAYASNGTDDIGNCAGGEPRGIVSSGDPGYKTGKITKTVISVGMVAELVGQSAGWLNSNCGGSNATNDIMVLLGGSNSTTTETRANYSHIISTCVGAVARGVLTRNGRRSIIISNGTDDKCAMCGGIDDTVDYGISEYFQPLVVSTGVTSTPLANLSKRVKTAVAVDTKTQDVAKIVAGYGTQSTALDIQQKTLVSTLVKTVDFGTLQYPRYVACGADNA
ncbi:MAG: hypothetical protein GY804_09040 [Alphaproteobacteria bacterium]|nr:hypothetical protein [Alphaproteobacteria bacterium]